LIYITLVLYIWLVSLLWKTPTAAGSASAARVLLSFYSLGSSVWEFALLPFLPTSVCRMVHENAFYHHHHHLLIYTVKLKKRNQFSFVCIFLVLDRNWWIFFTHIRPKKSRSIRYNSVYLILVYIEISAVTVTLNMLCLPVKKWNWWLGPTG